VADMLKKLKVFATEKGPNLLNDVHKFDQSFAKLQLDKIINKKQTQISGYFVSISKE